MIGGVLVLLLTGNFPSGTVRWSIKTGYEHDLIYKIKVLQYRSHKPRKVTIKDKQTVEATKKETAGGKPWKNVASTTEKPAPKEPYGCEWWYPVGDYSDPLWRWQPIYWNLRSQQRQKSKTPHWIYPGQSLDTMMQLFYQNNKTGDTWDLATVSEKVRIKTTRKGSAWSVGD